MSAADAVLAPLRGKGRTVRQALTEVTERWAGHRLDDAADRTALEDAVRHLLRRGQIRKELTGTLDPQVLAQRFVGALVNGEGQRAVEQVLGS